MKAHLCVALILVCVSAFSQEPPKPKREPAKTSVSAPGRGTEKEPVFVKGQITTSKTEIEAKEEVREKQEKLTIDRTLVEYTGWAAVFACLAFLAALSQVALFWWQLGLMRKSVIDADKAAQAAKTSADLALKEFGESHFPIIEVRRIQVRCDDKHRGILFVMANVGSATAKKIRGNVNISIVPSWEQHNLEKECLPPYGNVIIDVSKMIEDPKVFGKADIKPRERTFIFVESQEITPQVMDDIKNEVLTLTFFGYIDHEDESGTRRDTGFFRLYDPVNDRFKAKDDPDYEWT